MIINVASGALNHPVLIRVMNLAFIGVYLLFGLVALAAVGPSARWNTATLIGFFASLLPGVALFVAAGPVARWVSRSAVGRLWTKSLVRLASALLIGQVNMFLVFVVGAGLTPFLLGAGTAIVILLTGVRTQRTPGTS